MDHSQGQEMVYDEKHHLSTLPALSFDKSYPPTMDNFITSATHNLDSEPRDIVFSNLFLKLTTDIIGQAAFGVNFGLSAKKPVKDSPDSNVEVTDFINQHIYSTTQLKMDLSGSLSIILGLLVPILQEPFRQVMKRIPGTMDWRVEKTNARLSGQLNEILSKRAKETDTDSKDFLSLILKARESETFAKNIFTPDYISAVTYEHLLAGSTTTAFTLSSVLYLFLNIRDCTFKKLTGLETVM